MKHRNLPRGQSVEQAMYIQTVFSTVLYPILYTDVNVDSRLFPCGGPDMANSF
jgi:hypothetical protein